MVNKYCPTIKHPIVDIGGLPRPCVARYEKTIDAMKAIEGRTYSDAESHDKDVRAAQTCRYEDRLWPLLFLGQYLIENPELPDGLPIERLHEKYPRTIGLAICLSVLEHVDEPWFVEQDLHKACAPGATLIVSVPWQFPWHGDPVDHFRYSPTGLRKLFGDETLWEILEADWRLDIPASAGVLDIKTGRAQITQTCYIVCRAK